MKRILFYFVLFTKWAFLVIGVFSLVGYSIIVAKVIMKYGWEGFVAIHHHNAFVNGRTQSNFDFIFYPLLIISFFITSFILHFIGKKSNR